MSSYASEAGHWYKPNGSPFYTVVGSSGVLRKTTKRDAKKVGAGPGVTDVIKVAAAPALENWKHDRLLEAAIANPFRAGEDIVSYCRRVKAAQREEAAKVPDLGTKIHGDIEKALFDTVWIPSPEASAAIRTLGAWCGLDGLRSEKSFFHPMGFGGKVDVHKLGFVADWKTKDFGPDELPLTYDNHAWQLSAYRNGLKMPAARCAIIYVSTRIPGLTHLVEVTPAELDRGWEMFKLLLRFWQLKNDYEPTRAMETA